MSYLLAAFLFLWGSTFAYLFSLMARAKRLERDVELLQERNDARREASWGGEA